MCRNIYLGKRVLVLAMAVAATAATTLATTAADTPTTLTGSQVAATHDGLYKIQNDGWASSAGSITTDLGADFTVTRPSISPDVAAGEPGGYPSIYQGCHWGNCSGGPLAAHPVRAGTGVTSSWSTTQPGGSSIYNMAFDGWFNSAPRTSGRPDCAELMVWLNHSGSVQPAGSRTGAATIDGTHYSVWYGTGAWKTISYDMTRPETSVRNLDIGHVARDAVRRGYLSASCYLISMEGGFEVWRGGTGLGTKSFSVHVHHSP
jgi:Glycosyl hydrolase family 12